MSANESTARPSVSVIIPLKNAESVVAEQLRALADQTYEGPWELVLADNGSTDRSLSVVEEWKQRIPGMRVIDASARKGAAAARNIGARAAGGDLLVFCDADDVVSPGWLEAMATALTAHDFVTGPLDHFTLNEGVTEFRPNVTTSPIKAFLPYGPTANIGVSRKAFDTVDGFEEDLSIAPGEDADFSFRVQLAGFDLYFEPGARIAYRHRERLRDLWRQWWAYGVIWPALYKRFKEHGMPRARIGWIGYVHVTLVLRIPGALFSRERRVKWVRQAAWMWGRIRGSIRERIFYP